MCLILSRVLCFAGWYVNSQVQRYYFFRAVATQGVRIWIVVWSLWPELEHSFLPRHWCAHTTPPSAPLRLPSRVTTPRNTPRPTSGRAHLSKAYPAENTRLLGPAIKASRSEVPSNLSRKQVARTYTIRSQEQKSEHKAPKSGVESAHFGAFARHFPFEIPSIFVKIPAKIAKIYP
jgi:hypothetical protein